jgi:hypothetical protein
MPADGGESGGGVESNDICSGGTIGSPTSNAADEIALPEREASPEQQTAGPEKPRRTAPGGDVKTITGSGAKASAGEAATPSGAADGMHHTLLPRPHRPLLEKRPQIDANSSKDPEAGADGTIAAEEAPLMQSMVQMDKPAGLAVKNLPVQIALSEKGDPGFGHEGSDRRRATNEDATVSAIFTTGAAIAATPTRGGFSAEARSAGPLATRLAEAALEGEAHIRRTGSHSVTVAVAPDAGSQWLLQVERSFACAGARGAGRPVDVGPPLG